MLSPTRGRAGISPARLAAFFADATVGPVLTAHPNEVRRKSTIDRKLEVAELLAARGRPFLTAVELRANEMALRRAVLTLWQTNPLLRTRVSRGRRRRGARRRPPLDGFGFHLAEPDLGQNSCARAGCRRDVRPGAIGAAISPNRRRHHSADKSGSLPHFGGRPASLFRPVPGFSSGNGT